MELFMRQILLSDYYSDFYESEKGDHEERQNKRSILFITVIIIGVIIVPAMFYVKQRVKYSKLSYEINSLMKVEKELSNENALLQAKKEQMSSLERIELIAKTKLGLVVPDERMIPLKE
jgi:cell division protein FtsL